MSANKTQAQKRFDEIQAAFLGPTGAVQMLVKAFRDNSVPQDKAMAAFAEMEYLVNEARETYKAAVAQPAPTMPRRRVEL